MVHNPQNTCDKHACDFENNSPVNCDPCGALACGECARDLGESYVCESCWEKEESEAREWRETCEAALSQANAAWFERFGDLDI